MKILISGSAGFIGKALVSFFIKEGHEVFELTRSKNKKKIYWDPVKKQVEKDRLEGVDVVICLNGIQITQRWTKAFKQKIFSSRIDSAKFLTETLASLKNPPKVYMQASGTGFYGDALDRKEEGSPCGNLFLSKVCSSWERAADPCPQETRKVFLRFGMVLGKKGGALRKILPLFKLGLGSIMGKKDTLISWIAIQDLCFGIKHIITSSVEGPVNMVSPEVVTAEVFYKSLGKVLHRPCILFIPKILVRLVFGQMGCELFLANSNVYPKKLLASGFHFHYKEIKKAFLGELVDEA